MIIRIPSNCINQNDLLANTLTAIWLEEGFDGIAQVNHSVFQFILDDIQGQKLYVDALIRCRVDAALIITETKQIFIRAL